VQAFSLQLQPERLHHNRAGSGESAMQIDRYHRQKLLTAVGDAGQAKLARSRVLLVGCGALGTVIAGQLVRAGVGHLRVADRDVVELTNLQRQTLFTEADVQAAAPKAVAAATRLRAVNSQVTVEPAVTDVHARNIEDLVLIESRPADLILDGTDNAETRYLINDASVKHAIPWVYGACVGTEGRVMPIVPGVGPCLRCVFPNPPAPGELPTCDTAGVLGPAAAVVASLQSVCALKLLLGGAGVAELTVVDPWLGRFRSISLEGARREDCPTCGQRRFEFLETPTGPAATSLCGRNAVQVSPSGQGAKLDMARVEHKLAAAGRVRRTPYLVRCELLDVAGLTLTVFADGRAIVHGTNDAARARSIYARYVGS